MSIRIGDTYISGSAKKISDLTDDTATNPIDKADTLTGLTSTITELNYTDGVTSNIQTQLDSKQPNLTAGTGISIDANNVISSTVTVATDNTTVSKNASDQLQAIGVIDNKTSSADKLWTGTLAEYNALSSKDSNTFYNITDDTSGGTSVYTKTEVDTLLSAKATDTAVVHLAGNETITGVKLFNSTAVSAETIKVGKVSLTEASNIDIAGYDTNNARIGNIRFNHTTGDGRQVGIAVCDENNVNKGGITVGSSADGTSLWQTLVASPASSSNSTQIATTAWVRSLLGDHYIVAVQEPTSSNNYIWYRKYADGWVVQGVNGVDMTSAEYTFTFPVTMANTKYNVSTAIQDTLNTTTMGLKVNSLTTTSIKVRNSYQTSGSTLPGWIRIEGMSA